MTEPHYLAARVVVALALAGAFCAAFASALTLVVGHTEGVDTAVFLAAFAVALPVAVIAVARRGSWSPVAPEAESWIAGVAAFGLVVVLALARIVDEIANDGGGGPVVLLALIAGWFAAMAIVVPRAAGRSLHPARVFGGAAWPWVSGALAVVLIVALACGELPARGDIVISLALAAALLAVHRLLSPDRLGRAVTVAFDLVAVAVILLLVGDVSIFTIDAASWGLQLHQNSFLGATNDVLEGRTMLVDTYSIYGVGSIYALAALFDVVPIGYGSFGLVVAAGFALTCVAGYAILRLAGASQVLAITATAAAIASSVFSTVATPATFPSLGILRWGFAYLLVLLAVWSARRGRGGRGVDVASAVVVGLSSVWSFEVFVYTGVTYAALTAYRAGALPQGAGGLRAWARMVAPAALAVVVMQLLLVLFTVVRAGELPNWGDYFAIVREFSTGPYNRLVAPPWWIGIAIGALLFASAVTVAAVLRRLPSYAEENRTSLLAIAGLTAFGIATLTYSVRFSSADAVARADLPAVMVTALWVQLADRSQLARFARTALALIAFWLAALLIVASWDHMEREAGRSALIAALPGNDRSVESEISRVWDNPPVQQRSAAAEGLLNRYWPQQDEALVLLHPDLSVEALMRTSRVNLLPVSSVLADNLVAEESWERVRPVVDRLEPGTLMLTEPFYLTPGATRDYVNPDSPPLELEQLVIDRIRERFHLQPVTEERVGFDPLMGDDELVVVRLEER